MRPDTSPREALERHETGDEFDTVETTSTWRPVDLADALAGVDVDPPAMLARTDGVMLIYAGRTHQFAGESESCKTWAALVAARDELMARRAVLWIDFEDDARGIVARMRALLVPVDIIAAYFVYVRPEEPLFDRYHAVTAGGSDFTAVLTSGEFALAVVDGVTEAMTTEGLDLISNADAALWMRRVPKRIASVTGAGVIVIDHVTKASDSRGRYALGAQHKLAGITGAAYRFDAVRRFSRAVGCESITGSVKVTVVKDRPGHVRAHAVDDAIAVLELTSYGDGTVTSQLLPPTAAASGPPQVLLGRIAEFLATYDGASKNAIETEIGGKAERVRDALKWLVDPSRAWVKVEKSGNTHRHSLTEAGRAALL